MICFWKLCVFNHCPFAFLRHQTVAAIATGVGFDAVVHHHALAFGTQLLDEFACLHGILLRHRNGRRACALRQAAGESAQIEAEAGGRTGAAEIFAQAVVTAAARYCIVTIAAIGGI